MPGRVPAPGYPSDCQFNYRPLTLLHQHASQENPTSHRRNNLSGKHSSHSATSRTPAIPWDSDGDGVDTSISVLLDWLTTGINFKRYRGNTSGTTKVTMIQEVLDEMAAVGITHRNVKGVQTKIAELQGSYGKACDILRKTGSGVTDEDIRNGTSNLRNISVPNLLADLSADKAEEEPMEETPTNGAVTSEPNEGAGDDEEASHYVHVLQFNSIISISKDGKSEAEENSRASNFRVVSLITCCQ
ncbi:hypothetical protein H4Q26_000723 [Puccinia striiformis f. sp. tritici PST-130]|nr:hypothetical protein H4Q26_000723 [Puccinia striiformis f. sp. tritici PST-130]